MGDLEKAIKDIKDFQQSHIAWAEYFENNPKEETKRLKSGEWDTAIVPRKIVAKYDRVLKILENVKTNTNDAKG